jgi:hypothetical protein
MYRCANRCEQGVALSAAPLEEFVVGFLREAFAHRGFRVGDDAPNVKAAEVTLLEAEQELEAFAADTKARTLLGRRYHRAMEERVNEVERARSELDGLLDAREAARVVIPEELWNDLSPAELRDTLSVSLNSVVVARGRGPLASRVRVVPKGIDSGAMASAQDS